MVNKEYFENAAKSIPWKVDVKEKLIFVSPQHMKEAEDNLFVQHLRNHGFHIQLGIDAEKRPEFKPVYRNKPEKKSIGISMSYTITSTNTKIELVSQVGNTFTFKYLNKAGDFICGIEHIEKSVKLGVWKEIK